MKKIIIVFILLTIFSLGSTKKVNAYGECDQYGLMAMYDGLGSCKCLSGYVMGQLLGQPYCVSGTSVCYDKYGYGSEYDSLSKSCECSYGYVFGTDIVGRTQCISEDDSCKNQYGYDAHSTYGGKCECDSGYVFNDDNKCEYGNTVCSLKHGTYSSYDSLTNQCICDDGYTLDDSSQCVEKQNNVYFTLKELDIDNKQAIIRSDYDFGYYLVTYNSGCYDSSFERYLNKQIVVNLGTDYDVDTWDKIILQDDDETCDITQKEKVDSDFSLESKDEDPMIYYAPVIKPKITTPINKISTPKAKVISEVKKEDKDPVVVKNESKENSVPLVTPIPTGKVPWYKKVFNWFF